MQEQSPVAGGSIKAVCNITQARARARVNPARPGQSSAMLGVKLLLLNMLNKRPQEKGLNNKSFI